MNRSALEAMMEAISVIRHMRDENQYRYPENTLPSRPQGIYQYHRHPRKEENGTFHSLLNFSRNISNIKDAERRVNIVAHFIPPRLRLKSGQTLSPLTL